MLFNSRRFGRIIEVLEEGVFNKTEIGTGVAPPPEAFILIDDSEAYLLDDSDDILIT